MAYYRTDGFIGGQNIADTVLSTDLIGTGSTAIAARHPLGTVCKARDATYGEGEFIYLLGVASTVVGSIVTYNASTYQTALCAVGTGISPSPVAVAMSANVAGSYGWYQIAGVAVCAKAATICCVAGAAVGVKTIGLISKGGSLTKLESAVCAATASAKTGVVTVLVQMRYPHNMAGVV